MTTIKFSKENVEKIRQISKEANLLFTDVGDMVNQKQEELKGLVSVEGAIFIVGKELGVNVDPVKPKKTEVDDLSIFDDIDLSTNEFNPFLKVKNGIVYTLKLIDPTKKPRPSIDGYGNTQYIWEVRLLDISPKKAMVEEDKEGKLLFIKNKVYSFGLKKTAMRRLKDYWESIGTPDEFTFERVGQSFQTDYVFKEK